MNLVEGLLKQFARNRELVRQYEEIGEAGKFGAARINADIKFAETALAEGNIINMIKAYWKLNENE